jgi:hypothetical protein
MSGSPLSEFTTFAQSQGSAWLGSAEDVLVDFTRNTYTWPRLIGAHSMQHMIQGGDAIKDRVMLSAQDTFERYDPNASFTFQQGNPGTEISLPWAFAKFDYSWNKHIIGLNVNQFTKAARAQKYKSVWSQLVSEAWANACERMDDELWAQPDYSLMESSSPTGPRVPMSIPAYINEFTDGLTPATVDAGGAAWTTKMGVDSAAKPQWVPHQGTYTFEDGAGTALPTTAAEAASFLRGLSQAFRKTAFDRLPKNEKYSDPKTSPNFIACSDLGIRLVEHALIVSQNRWNSLTSGGTADLSYPYPKFNGVPFDYISALDTATLYSDGAGAVDEENATVTGPRYYGINSKYLKMVIHSENFCTPAEVNPSAQPFSHSMIYDIWNNLFACSLRRHFVFSPSASVPAGL